MPIDVEARVREELERMSREVATDPVLPPPVRRDARRRALATVVASATAVAVLVSASVIGIRWLGHGRGQPAVGPPCTWSEISAPSEDPSRFDTYLRSVTASGPNDALAVGIYRVPGEGSADHLELLHWDGTRWTAAAAPPVPEYGEGPSIFGVASTGADDAWAVGLRNSEQGGAPLALHWDGQSWSASDMPDAAEPETHLFGVAALTADDAWAVGGWARPGKLQGGGLAMHWDGTAWSAVSVPRVPPIAATGGPYDILDAASGTSATDVWAVGQSLNVPETTSQSLAMHWDGDAWSVVPTPKVRAQAETGVVDNQLLGVTAVAPDDAWAVGSYQGRGALGAAARPLALHWDGTDWSAVDVPDVGLGELDGVAATAPDEVWAVGSRLIQGPTGPETHPLLLHWDGGGWYDVPSPVGAQGSLLAVTAIPGGGLWAVGSRGPGSPARSLVLRCS